MMTTLFIGTNYAYMNPPFYGEFNLFINRLIAVFAGVTIYLVAELFIFKRHYTNATSVIEHEKINQTITNIASKLLSDYYHHSLTLEALNQKLGTMLEKKSALLAHKKSALQGFSQQDKTIELIHFYIQKMDTCIAVFRDIGSEYLLTETISSQYQAKLVQLTYLKMLP